MKQFSFLFIFIVAIVVVVTDVHAGETATRSVLVSIDTSASMRKGWAAYQQIAGDLIKTAQDGTSFTLISFDQTSSLVARTDSMSNGVRETLLERVSALKPAGQFTDFRAGVDAMASAIRAAPSPSVLIVMSDGLSDPRPGVSVEGLDRLLLNAFPAEAKDLAIWIIVPDLKALSRLQLDGRLHAVVSTEFHAENIIYRSSPSSSPGPRLEIHWFRWMLFFFKHLKAIAYTALAALLLVSAWRVRCWTRRWRKRLRPGDMITESADPSFELCASYRDTTIRLGRVEDIHHLTIGSVAGSDVPVESGDGELTEVDLKRGHGEDFTVQNRGSAPVLVDAMELLPGKCTDVRLPVTVGFGERNDVHLTLLPMGDERTQERSAS